MKTIVLSANSSGTVQKAAVALKEGKTIIYPTETSYGIGCDALDQTAVKRVHRAKKEPVSKPLIVLVADLKTAKRFGVLSKTDELLVKKFMPGPLTLVVERKKGIPAFLGKKTIAFRVSSNKFALALSKKFGSAVVSTSANLHGKKPLFDAKKVVKEFGGKVDLIVDAGVLPKREPSTIYDSKNKKVVRKGKILWKKS